MCQCQSSCSLCLAPPPPPSSLPPYPLSLLMFLSPFSLSYLRACLFIDCFHLIQTHTKFKITLFIRTKHSLQSCMLCFVLINSVLLNLLCVWILFQNSSSRFCFRFLFPFEFRFHVNKTCDLFFFFCFLHLMLSGGLTSCICQASNYRQRDSDST